MQKDPLACPKCGDRREYHICPGPHTFEKAATRVRILPDYDKNKAYSDILHEKMQEDILSYYILSYYKKEQS
jgi:hypothetical protein